MKLIIGPLPRNLPLVVVGLRIKGGKEEEAFSIRNRERTNLIGGFPTRTLCRRRGGERERKVGFGSSGGADSDNWNSRKKVEVNGGSESGRPRLVLQPRSVSVNVSDGSQEGGFGNVAKARGPNPFGSARPREEVLAEKGQDWKKIDEQLESMKIKEAVVGDKKDGFGKRVFGSGNGRAAALPDYRVERSSRKPQSESDDVLQKGSSVMSDNNTKLTVIIYLMCS